MERSIAGYHLDEDKHWVAELDCGHFQHVRHNPPWSEKPWVLTEEGRASMIGTSLDCLKCESGAPPDHL